MYRCVQNTDRKLGMGHPEYAKMRLNSALGAEPLPHSQPNSLSPDHDQDSFTNVLEDSGSQSLNQRLVNHGVLGLFFMYPCASSLTLLKLISDSRNEEISSVPQPSFSHSPSLHQAFVKGSRGDESVLNNSSSESSPLGSTTQPRMSEPDMEDKNKRECAKLVLQELYDYNIGFEKLLAEGIDASLLLGLYREIGIAVPYLSLQQLDPCNTSNGTTVAKANDVVDLASTGTLPARAGHKSDRTLETQKLDTSNSTQSVPDREVQHDQSAFSDQNALTAAQNTVNASTVLEPSHTPKVSSANLPKKPVMATSVDKAIERKDYIAKMLAAKAGRNATTAKPSRPAEPSALQVEVKDSNKETNSRTASPAIPTTASIPVPLEKATNTEDIRRAQTELARRKIEALKTRIEPHREEPSKSTQEPAPLPLHATFSRLSPPLQERSPNISQRVSKEPPAPLQLPAPEQPIPKPSPTPQFTPSRSFFSSLGRRPANGIPGLFSFSAPVSPPLSQQEMITPTTSTVNAIQAIPEQLTTSSLQQSIRQPSVVPIPQEDLDMDKNHIDSPIPVTASPLIASIPAPETTHEQSRKRPTAADFIESPATRIKRRLGSSEQVDVLIEISEDEDHSDNDEMDVDNLSTSIAPPPPTGMADSAKAQVIRDLPPLSDFPPRTKSQVVSFASTPPMVHTPGKVKDQEILKVKEEQILLMQRKIAEMEQRKKAKQAISRAQTPGMRSPRQVENYSDIAIRTPTLEKGTDFNLYLQQSIKAADQKLEAQQAVLIAAEEAVRKKQEAEERQKGEVEERQRQEVEDLEKQEEEQRVKAVMLAEAESERAEVQKAKMPAESRQRQKRSLELKTALPELDMRLERAKYKLEETRKRLESMRQEMTELEAAIEQGIQGRGIILKELHDIAKAEEETSTLVHRQPITRTEQAIKATGADSPGK